MARQASPLPTCSTMCTPLQQAGVQPAGHATHQQPPSHGRRPSGGQLRAGHAIRWCHASALAWSEHARRSALPRERAASLPIALLRCPPAALAIAQSAAASQSMLPSLCTAALPCIYSAAPLLLRLRWLENLRLHNGRRSTNVRAHTGLIGNVAPEKSAVPGAQAYLHRATMPLGMQRPLLLRRYPALHTAPLDHARSLCLMLRPRQSIHPVPSSSPVRTSNPSRVPGSPNVCPLRQWLPTWKEHMSVSSTLIMAPAFSNSPQ